MNKREAKAILTGKKKVVYECNLQQKVLFAVTITCPHQGRIGNFLLGKKDNWGTTSVIFANGQQSFCFRRGVKIFFNYWQARAHMAKHCGNDFIVEKI